MYKLKASLLHIPVITGAIWLACTLRGSHCTPFMTTSTNTLQGRYLFGTYYYPLPIFIPELMKILGSFFLSYIIPALLIWIASFLLYRWLLILDLSISPDIHPNSDPHNRSEKRLFFSLFLAGFLLSMFFSHYLFLNRPSNSDEFSYLFQAKIIGEGKLFEISPPLTNPFQATHLINNGHWFSKYPIGWPALMAMGGLIGNYHLFADLSLGIFLVIFCLTAKELFDRSASHTGLLFLICSPYLFFNAASYQPHMVDLCILSFSFLMFINFLKHGRPVYAFFFSLLLGLSVFIRPVDTALVIPAYLFFLIRNPFRETDRASAIKTFLRAGLPVFIVLSALWLLSNYLITGSLLKTGYSFTYNTAIDIKSYIPMLWDLIYPLLRLFIWLPYPVFELVIASLIVPGRFKFFILLMIIPTLIFYMAWGQGGIEIGPRYFFPILGLVVLLAVSGLQWFNGYLCRHNVKKPLLFTQCLLCCSAIVSVIMLFPTLPDKIRQYSLTLAAFQENVEALTANGGKNVIIFVRNLPDDSPSLVSLRNFAPLTQRIVYANFLEPSQNKAVIALFPERTPFLLRYEPSSNEMMIEPYTEERQNSRKDLIEDLYFAAFNYQGIQVREMSKNLYREVISLNPGHIDAYLRLAKLDEEEQNYDRAISTLEELQTATGRDYPEIHFYIARIYTRKGNYTAAKKELDKIDIQRMMPIEGPRARDLMKYLHHISTQ